MYIFDLPRYPESRIISNMAKTTVKEVVLCVCYACATIGSLWLWRFTAQIIAQEAFDSYGQFIASISSLVLAASFFGITAVVVRNAVIMYLFVGISIAVPFLYIPFSKETLVIAGCAVIFALLAARRVRKDVNLSWGFSIAHMFKSGIPLFLTVCGIIIASFYLNDVQKKDAVQAIFPRTAFDVTIRTLGGPLKSITGGQEITPDETVDEFLKGLIAKQLENRGARIDQVPQKELARLLTEQRDEIARSYGIKLTGNENLADVFYTTIIERINDLLGPYRMYAPYASAIAFFLAFKTLSFFLYFVIIVIAFLLIRLMIMIRVVTRKKEQIEVERLMMN